MKINILPTHHNAMTLTLYDIENKSESKTNLLRFVSFYRMNFIYAVLILKTLVKVYIIDPLLKKLYDLCWNPSGP